MQMSRSKTTFASCMVLLGMFGAVPHVLAEIGDPTLRTDHSVYPGEGAFQTVEDCVAFATAESKTTHGKAIALYLWMLQHQYHETSPQEWRVSNVVPDPGNPKDALTPLDANVARFSYGYGLCGTVHAWNEPYWQALGFQTRRRAFPGHTNSEVFYDRSWHAFDTDMAGLVFCEDRTVAGYRDIAANPDLVKHTNPPLPCYPFAWPADFQAMKQGWEQVASEGEENFYRMYSTGYAANPGIVRLRSGERFTRRFDRDAYGGLEKRRFWYASPKKTGGPSRNWTFVNSAKVEHAKKLDPEQAMGNASYCNAEFLYEPDLSSSSYLEGVASKSANLMVSDASQIKSSDGEPAFVTFFHDSPYVIAGDPVDDKDSMTGKATDGCVITGEVQGKVNVSVSIDGGVTWQQGDSVDGEFRFDITEMVKGRYHWQIRFVMDGDNELISVRFKTVCQMNQAMYPRLTPDGCNVTYRCRSRGVTRVEPVFIPGDESLLPNEVKEMRSPNVIYQGQRHIGDKAYRTTNNKPGQIVYRIDSPQPLLQVNAAAMVALRVPMPEESDFRLEVSTDNGMSWQPMAKADIPNDNNYSMGWLAGSADVSTANVKSVLVRIHLYLGGYTTGLYDFEAYGIHQTSTPEPVKIIYDWEEAGQEKRHEREFDEGRESVDFVVPTGENIKDKSVTIIAE